MNGLAAQYALFLAEMATLVLAAIGLVAGMAALSRRKDKNAGHIEVTDINRQLKAAGDRIQAAQLPRNATEACSYLLPHRGSSHCYLRHFCIQ